MVLGLLLTPIVLLAKLWSALFWRGSNLSPEDVASFIRSGLAPEDDGRWDDLEHIRIRDGRLENIRRKAAAVKFPLNDVDRAKLEELLVELGSEQRHP